VKYLAFLQASYHAVRTRGTINFKLYTTQHPIKTAEVIINSSIHLNKKQQTHRMAKLTKISAHHNTAERVYIAVVTKCSNLQ
jgi:hypothetical protein